MDTFYDGDTSGFNDFDGGYDFRSVQWFCKFSKTGAGSISICFYGGLGSVRLRDGYVVWKIGVLDDKV